MNRFVRIATVQPPAPTEGATPDAIQQRTLDLLRLAAQEKPDVVCLPEYANCMACGPEQASARAEKPARDLVEAVAEHARSAKCWVIVSVLIDTDAGRFNRAHLIDRRGKPAGHFDKVHLTRIERDEWRVTAGGEWPVFECDFGRIGIMICYDGCFPEPARILALKGADILFWASLQRTYTETELDLQTRSHAYFNHVIVVRSSYGTERGLPWAPGDMVGMSCICNHDGHMLADLGRWVGWTSATVDLDAPQRGPHSFGGEIGLLKEMRMGDRRPDTYGALTAPRFLERSDRKDRHGKPVP